PDERDGLRWQKHPEEHRQGAACREEANRRDDDADAAKESGQIAASEPLPRKAGIEPKVIEPAALPAQRLRHRVAERTWHDRGHRRVLREGDSVTMVDQPGAELAIFSDRRFTPRVITDERVSEAHPIA